MSKNHSETKDILFMKTALRLAAEGRGQTAPNPMVGALVVKNDRILSSAYHRGFGQVHAERAALESINEAGCTLYSTLEPCCHYGKTPPCTEIIMARKVARVVMATSDPFPAVNGRGAALLRESGIEVCDNVLSDQARSLNRHYFTAQTMGRPYLAIHAAISLDGKTTDRNSHSQWVTSAGSRALSHDLRGEFSAILAGAGTIRQDNPFLTIRSPGWPEKRLFRVILNPANDLPAEARIFSQQERFPTILFSSDSNSTNGRRCARHFFIPAESGRFDLKLILARLLDMGIDSILVEGGGLTIDAFLQQDLWDEMIVFQSRSLIGGEKSGQIYASGAENLTKALSFQEMANWETSGSLVIRGRRKCLPDW